VPESQIVDFSRQFYGEYCPSDEESENLGREFELQGHSLVAQQVESEELSKEGLRRYFGDEVVNNHQSGKIVLNKNFTFGKHNKLEHNGGLLFNNNGTFAKGSAQ
jgi:hypothetical protein